MIEVNLLPGKRKAAKGGGGLKLPNFGAILANVKDPWLIGAVVSFTLVAAGAAALFAYDARNLSVVNAQLESVRNEKRRYDVVIAQKRQFEKIRDSLVAQITVIRGIDADRYIWPHILDQVTKALPPYTWLTAMRAAVAAAPAGQPPGAPVPAQTDSLGRALVNVTVEGRTVDIEAYTTFLRQLAASPWLTDVNAQTSHTVVESDRPVTAFAVSLQFRVADSAFIRTVPLVQSVR